MSSEIHVSPIDGDNVLLVNGFKIEIVILSPDLDPVIVYRIFRKGVHIGTYTSLQEAVEWCKD